MSATNCPIELPVRTEINKLITNFVKSVGKEYHNTYSRPGKTQHNLKVCRVVLSDDQKTQLLNKLNNYNHSLHYIIDYSKGAYYNHYYYGGLTVRVFADADKWCEYMRQKEINVFGEHVDKELHDREASSKLFDEQLAESETSPSTDGWKYKYNDQLFEQESDQDCILMDGPITSDEMHLIDELRNAKLEIAVLRKAYTEVEYHDHECKLRKMIEKMIKRWKKVGITL